MLSLTNLSSNIGRPSSFCDYIKKKAQDKNFINSLRCKEIINTALNGNLPIYTLVKAYTLVFIPWDYLEAKITSEAIINSLEDIQPILFNLRSERRIEHSISHYEKQLEIATDKYPDADSILDSGCCMIIFDVDKVIDVYNTTPKRYIESTFLSKVDYECSACGKVHSFCHTSRDSYCPEGLYYRTRNGEVEYFCSSCKEQNDNPPLLHVGDSLDIFKSGIRN